MSEPFREPADYIGDVPGHQEQLDRAGRALKACGQDSSSTRRDDLDQCPATITTTLRRLELLLGTVDIEKPHLLLLGDDDLLSVAVTAAGLSMPVTVVDLDRSLLSRIASWTKASPVELVHHDLRFGLPANLVGRSDVVFTDPPYTSAGQLLFLRAGITALRRAASSSLFFCASRSYLTQEEIKMIIDAVEAAGLRLVSVYEDFNEYKAPPDVVRDIQRLTPGADSSLLHSSLFHFKPEGDALDPESLPFLPADIYEYEEEMPRVNYTHLTIECLGCNKAILNTAFEVRKALREAASICKLHVLKEDLHRFRPQGITGYVLLSESHISIHTWPEQGFALVDVLSCSSVEIESLQESFRRSLSARSIKVFPHAQAGV